MSDNNKIDDDSGSVGSKGSKGSIGSKGSKGSKAQSAIDDEDKKKVEFWRCNTCATFNPDTVDECKACWQPKDGKPKKKKKFCLDCGHLHRQGVYCHVYCELDIDDDDDDDEVEEEDDDELDQDDEEGDVALGTEAKKIEVTKAADDLMTPLATPPFVKAIRFVRCNCDTGVPEGNPAFLPVPFKIKVDDILIQTYHEIHEDKTKKQAQAQKVLSEAEEEMLLKIKTKEKNKKIAAIVSPIMDYLPLGLCGRVAILNKAWNSGSINNRMYCDVRDMVPWQACRPHAGQVDSVHFVGTKCFTGGDHRINWSDIETGQIIGTVSRDSGDIPFLSSFIGELFCCSTNGAVRTFTLSHHLKGMKLCKTLWNHFRAIKRMDFEIPSEGFCQVHGIMNHICVLYTTSEDRTIKLWDTSTFDCLATIQSPTLRTATFHSFAQSERHIFAGTSAAAVAVFTKHDICEREDVHSCSNPRAKKMHCLQLNLILPKHLTVAGTAPTVTALLCSGPNYMKTHLWAGDNVGYLTVWEIPYNGLDFKPIKSWKVHNSGLNQMVNTWRHVVSIGNDGNLILHDLRNLLKVRTINCLEWAVYRGLVERPDVNRRLTCMHLIEDAENGGRMVIGTSYGEILVMDIGTSV